MPASLEAPADRPFKICSCCAQAWASRDAFLADSSVVLLGYQSLMPDPALGLFLFNHDCGTTLTLRAEALADLHDGPIVRARHQAGHQATGSCLAGAVHQPCPSLCECEFVHHLTRKVGGDGSAPPGDG